MKAKEEAKELVQEYLNIEFCLLTDNQAKQCALICVDKILESHYKVLVGVMPKTYDYWQEVKQEINKL